MSLDHIRLTRRTPSMSDRSTSTIQTMRLGRCSVRRAAVIISDSSDNEDVLVYRERAVVPSLPARPRSPREAGGYDATAGATKNILFVNHR